MANLMTAHNAWATRPADERFWNVPHLLEHLRQEKDSMREKQVAIKELQAVAVEDDVCLVSSRGNPAQLTNWSFDQLCRTCDAPAGYLRTLTPATAVLNLNEKMPDDGDAQLLIKLNGHLEVRALTTPVYSRFWNLDVTERLLPALSRGWVTPPARPAVEDSRARPATAEDVLPNQGDFGLSVKVGDMIAPAGVYHSDRDMFIFLVNPSRIIDDGGKGLMRGVFIWNSEVGAGSVKFRTFMLEHVCGNHICWGATKVRDFRTVHKGDVQSRFTSEALSKLAFYADLDTAEDRKAISMAKGYILGKDKEEVSKKIYSMRLLNQGEIEESYDMATQWEHTAHAPPNSAWGFIHGLTRYSQLVPYADKRNKLDEAGGKLLDLVSKA